MLREDVPGAEIAVYSSGLPLPPVDIMRDIMLQI